MLAVGITEDQVVLVRNVGNIVELLARRDVAVVGRLELALKVLTASEMRSALILGLAVTVSAFVVRHAESVHDVATVVARCDIAGAALTLTVRGQVVKTVLPLVLCATAVSTRVGDGSIGSGPHVRARVADKVADLTILSRVGLAKHGVVLRERSTQRVTGDDHLLEVGVSRLVEELVDQIIERLKRGDRGTVGAARLNTGSPAATVKEKVVGLSCTGRSVDSCEPSGGGDENLVHVDAHARVDRGTEERVAHQVGVLPVVAGQTGLSDDDALDVGSVLASLDDVGLDDVVANAEVAHGVEAKNLGHVSPAGGEGATDGSRADENGRATVTLRVVVVSSVVVDNDGLARSVSGSSSGRRGTVLVVGLHDGTRALSVVKLLRGTVHAVNVGSNGRAGEGESRNGVESSELDHIDAFDRG